MRFLLFFDSSHSSDVHGNEKSVDLLLDCVKFEPWMNWFPNFISITQLEFSHRDWPFGSLRQRIKDGKLKGRRGRENFNSNHKKLWRISSSSSPLGCAYLVRKIFWAKVSPINPLNCAYWWKKCVKNQIFSSTPDCAESNY